MRITSGKGPLAGALADVRSVVQTAQDEVKGAGRVNVGMVVTATVTDRARLDDRRGTDLGTFLVLVHRAYGSEDTVFAASLPLGLMLPKHSMVPSEIMDAP